MSGIEPATIFLIKACFLELRKDQKKNFFFQNINLLFITILCIFFPLSCAELIKTSTRQIFYVYKNFIIQWNLASDSCFILWLIKKKTTNKHQLQNRMPWLHFITSLMSVYNKKQKLKKANKVETWYVKFSLKVNNKWKWNVC